MSLLFSQTLQYYPTQHQPSANGRRPSTLKNLLHVVVLSTVLLGALTLIIYICDYTILLLFILHYKSGKVILGNFWHKMWNK